MNILGISCYYHDAAACLMTDGRIIAAAAEERFSRKKHDNGFPKQAIDYCLRWAEMDASSLEAVVFYEKPIIKFERTLMQHLAGFPKSRKVFVDTIGSWFDMRFQIPKTLKKQFGYTGKTYYVEHHLAHAASAFYLSDFPEAAIVTLDGAGEWATTTMGFGKGENIRIDREIHFPHSLGLLYSAMTSYLGFSVNDAEYKVMGLAAYGDPKPFRTRMNTLVRQFDDGSFALDMTYFDFVWGERMYGRRLEELFGYPGRKSESPMERQYENIAASLQEKLEEVVMNILKNAYRRYNTKNVCLSGGVALNSVMNGKILRNTPFDHVFIPPDPGDGGGAMGAALCFWKTNVRFPDGKKPQFRESAHLSFSPYLGPSFPSEQMRDLITLMKLKYREYTDRDTLLNEVADHLINQKIVGWFQGRMEWGPRALGNRSILASAAKPEMKDIINGKVKHRELFRPFAPVVLDTQVKTYFKADRNLSPSSKYMLMVYPFTEKGKKEVPATVHVDGTGRLQVIERKDNPLYYDLVALYGQKTGTPIIINTSFNVRGEPIVCTPQDAIHCFLKTDIDFLVMDRFLVSKN